jgi:hypothetical protein
VEIHWRKNLLVYGIFLALVVLKLFSTSFIQAYARMKSKKFRHQDDADFFGKGQGIAGAGLSKLDEVSIRVWQNDIENIYPYLVVSLLFSLSAPEIGSQIILFSSYFFLRVGHTLFLYFPRQPWRNIFYQGANGVLLVTLAFALKLLY